MATRTIYVASKVAHASKWLALRRRGYTIVSSWIDEAGPDESADLSDLWVRCVNEASAADLVICYREPNEILKGAFVEVGAALASGKPVRLIGFDDGLVSFVNHPGCSRYPSIEAALTV